MPVAPELGLFLDECLFGAYNKRFGYDHEELSMRDFKQQARGRLSLPAFLHSSISSTSDTGALNGRHADPVFGSKVAI